MVSTPVFMSISSTAHRWVSATLVKPNRATRARVAPIGTGTSRNSGAGGASRARLGEPATLTGHAAGGVDGARVGDGVGDGHRSAHHWYRQGLGSGGSASRIRERWLLSGGGDRRAEDALPARPSRTARRKRKEIDGLGMGCLLRSGPPPESRGHRRGVDIDALFTAVRYAPCRRRRAHRRAAAHPCPLERLRESST